MIVELKRGLATVVAGVILCVTVTIEQANAQSTRSQAASAAAASGGPTTDQLLAEAKDKAEEFEAFDWPPQGRGTLFPGATQAYVDFNERLWTDYGILYLFLPTIMMQKGSQGGGQDFTANEQYQTVFAWQLLDRTRIGTGYFIFNNLHVSQLTRTSGADLAQSLGINFFPSDSAGNVEVIKALLWRHEFPGDFLTLHLGQDNISDLDGGCRYSCDDTTSFLASPLATNVARTLPGQGLGASAEIQPIDGVFIEGMLADARGDGKINFGRPFDTGEWAYAGSLKFENPLSSLGDGVYRLTYYQVDATRQGTPMAQSATEGLTFQVDQDFGDFGFFAKYSRAFQRKGSIEQYGAAGVVWKKPFENDEDWLGFGFGWVDPTAPGSNNEYVLETYYRAQLTPFVQLTPDVMAVINPSNNPDQNVEGVFSLRVRGHY